MHGLVNRALQCFLRDTYGAATWAAVAEAAGVQGDGFEAMLSYEDALTYAVLGAAAEQLRRPREQVLEDLGTYLVSHPNLEPLRRLLRFGGVNFVEFLHSLDDLQGRGRLAVPDLDLPALELGQATGGRYTLICRSPHDGFGHMVVGVLRAMADDYGALVLLDHIGRMGDESFISIEVSAAFLHEGRSFDLAAGAA